MQISYILDDFPFPPGYNRAYLTKHEPWAPLPLPTSSILRAGQSGDCYGWHGN